MNDAFSRLLKVLTLERKQGYRNKAVIGGLDKFASRWEMDARAETSHGAAVNEIVALMLGYPAVEDLSARERIIEQIINRAEEAARQPAPATLQHSPAPSAGGPAQAPPSPRGQPSPAVPPGPAGPSGPTTTRARDRRSQDLPAPAPPVARASAATRAPETVGRASVDATEPARGSAAAAPSETHGAAAPARPMPAPSKPDRPASDSPRAADAERSPASSEEIEFPPSLAERRPATGAAPAPAPSSPTFAIRDSGLDAPVTRLPGVGPSLAQKLGNLHVATVRDLLYLLPYRYEDYSSLRTIDKLRYGEEVTIIATVWDVKSRIIGGDRKMITAIVGDGSGEMAMTWFNPWVERRLRGGHAYTFSGKVDSFRDHLVMRNPEFEPLESDQVSTGRLVPIYPLTEGISARWLRRIMKSAVDAWATDLPDFLPGQVRDEASLMTLGEALTQIHFPDSKEEIAAAHRRLSFDEFLALQLGVLGHRRRFRQATARPLRADDEVLAPFLEMLPFQLTGAQQRVLADIAADLCKPQPMSRLLQGDVGSGKTAVAAAALWIAVASGTQGAIMAPTEILAEQHARSFEAIFAGLENPAAGRPVRVALLIGGMRQAEREALLADLAEGKVDIAIGTHALIQEGVSFRELSVAVADEQHRFGVEQRAALRYKGIQPHMLVMSATPIPRSLALTVYGDLDVSVLDEMPAGRIPVKTKWLTSSQRERAYGFIRRQVESGRQAFIIHPLVEEGKQTEARAAVEEHARLSQVVFPDLRLGLLHGRLPSDEKDRVMRAFVAGELDVLVATSIVEVGIDVPNATVMVIESADRFGLAQLHQFRGRVGRGEYPSYCILISDAAEGDSIQRLQALENSTDGFALAQVDLDMRGPGDFLGTRQSGLPPLRTAQLGDLPTLEAARGAAQKLFAVDPELSFPEHRALAEQVAALWAGQFRDLGEGAGDIS